MKHALKVKQTVKQEIESLISNPTRLLRVALATLFESERKNPEKLRAIYYNTTPPYSYSVERILSESLLSTRCNGYTEEDTLAKVLLPFIPRSSCSAV